MILTSWSSAPAIEDMVEQNDNSFDGIINNLPEDKTAIKTETARDSVLKKLKDCVKILEDEKDSHLSTFQK